MLQSLEIQSRSISNEGCAFLRTFFWITLFVSIPIPLYGLVPLLLSTCHAHHYMFQVDSPDELPSDFPLAICQKKKKAIQGQLP